MRINIYVYIDREREIYIYISLSLFIDCPEASSRNIVSGRRGI